MAVKIDPGSSRAAPFIYSDGVATFGVQGGVIQIELAANSIVPEGAETRSELLVVAHLRCGPAAAKAIRDAIDRALEMPSVEAAIMPTMPAASRPN
jgi:hypothetical protein